MVLANRAVRRAVGRTFDGVKVLVGPLSGDEGLAVTVLLWLIGLAIAIVILVYIMRWLYRRSTKETAFVRTGFLGEKVVVNGGAFVILVLHEITPVNMNVMRIEVVRRENSAPITRNRMRVDIIAEFFVRVGPSKAAVAAAAQTLGRRTLQEDGIRSLFLA